MRVAQMKAHGIQGMLQVGIERQDGRDVSDAQIILVCFSIIIYMYAMSQIMMQFYWLYSQTPHALNEMTSIHECRHPLSHTCNMLSS